MKKMYMIILAVAVALSAGQAFALPGVYNMGADTQILLGPACETRTISLDGTGFSTNPLVSGGFLLQNSNEAAVDITDCQCYDGALTPAVWDAGSLVVFDPTGYPGAVFVAASNLGAGVVPSANILVCDVTFCGVAAGTANLCVDSVPDFDTWVNQLSTVYDPNIDGDCIAVTVQGDPCECSITGPAIVQGLEVDDAVADYNAAGDADCDNPPDYVFSTDCTSGTIDPVTGILTVPAPGANEICTITATDTANTDINTGDPVVCTLPITIVAYVPPPACITEIALGRECPGETIDDPAYNRPGRRGLAATCDDIIDFTVCTNSTDPAWSGDCLVWSITPNLTGATITQIDDCCWRLIAGDTCDLMEKTFTEVVTVTDTCCGSTDSVEIEFGKVIIDIGSTNIQPNTESGTIDISMTNLDHSVRAITLDIAECDADSSDDNLECTQCLVDTRRTLDFTCSANEQADGSCRIVLYSTDPSAVIAQGRGPIAKVVYSAKGELDVCGEDACIDLCATNIKVSDQFNEDLCTCTSAGEVCFTTCGDIYPQDCIGGTCGALTCCGDGVIDLFDILEAVDIILNLQVATACQLANGDVPNGMPPYCGNPPGTPNCQGDGDIDIFDVLVMIDKALGKMNCCDYCLYGNIF
jgi:hypothetical protein